MQAAVYDTYQVGMEGMQVLLLESTANGTLRPARHAVILEKFDVALRYQKWRMPAGMERTLQVHVPPPRLHSLTLTLPPDSQHRAGPRPSPASPFLNPHPTP